MLGLLRLALSYGPKAYRYIKPAAKTAGTYLAADYAIGKGIDYMSGPNMPTPQEQKLTTATNLLSIADKEKLRKDLNIKTDEQIFGQNPLLETMYPDRNKYMQDSIKFFTGF